MLKSKADKSQKTKEIQRRYRSPFVLLNKQQKQKIISLSHNKSDKNKSGEIQLFLSTVTKTKSRQWDAR